MTSELGNPAIRQRGLPEQIGKSMQAVTPLLLGALDRRLQLVGREIGVAVLQALAKPSDPRIQFGGFMRYRPGSLRGSLDPFDVLTLHSFAIRFRRSGDSNSLR
jgi:hypothetical protein